MISIIIPTVAGREKLLSATIDAYKAATPDKYEIMIMRGHDTCGSAWALGAEQARGDLIHFAIDDAEPHPGWYEAALETLTAGQIASARMLLPDGSVEGCGSMGAGCNMPDCADWTPCRQSPIWVVSKAMYNRVGPLLPIHYFVDDDWFWRAHLHGIGCAVRRAFCFTHRQPNDAAKQQITDRYLLFRQQYINHAAGVA